MTHTHAHLNPHCELPQVNRCSHGLSQMLCAIRQLPFLLSTLGGMGEIHHNTTANIHKCTDIISDLFLASQATSVAYRAV